ncbi:methyl-accepting chemotaxis protein [Pelagicoccus mobilis]|nr:methyl-accepting chemotaxis protein [Pelagicoccus mobilis]
MTSTKRPLKTRLLIFSLLIAVGPLSLLIWRTGVNASKIEKDLLNSFGEYAISTIDIVERNLFERYGDAQAFAANEVLLDRDQWGKTKASENGVIRAMNAYMDLYDIYSIMIAVDLDGNPIAANTLDADGRPTDNSWVYQKNFKNEAWFRNAVSGNFLTGNGTDGTVVEDVHADPLVKRAIGGDGLAISYSTPIKDTNGSTIGVWTNRVSIQLLKDIIEDTYRNLAKIGYKTSEITLLDSQGRVVIDLDPHLNEGQIEANPDSSVILKLNLAEKGVQAAQAAVAGKQGAMLSFHARKKINQVAGYAHSDGAMGYKGLDWNILVRVNEEEAMAGFQALSRESVVISIACLLVAGFMAWSLSKRIANPLISITEQLDKTVQVTRDSAGALLDSSQSLADGSSEQAANVEETSSSTEQLNSMTAQNSESVARALHEVQSANLIVDDANSKLTALSEAMNEISAASDETKNIIKTIDEIAFQTNILALNAAVEAARAGEAGAGFAIVADEVRNLAARAAQAAQDTSGLLDQNIQKIAVGTESVDQTNAGFSELKKKTDRVSEIMREVNDASHQQTEGLKQITSAINQISHITQQNASGAEEVASASSDVDSQAVKITQSIANLHELVHGQEEPNKTPARKTTAPAPSSNRRIPQSELASFN